MNAHVDDKNFGSHTVWYTQEQMVSDPIHPVQSHSIWHESETRWYKTGLASWRFRTVCDFLKPYRYILNPTMYIWDKTRYSFISTLSNLVNIWSILSATLYIIDFMVCNQKASLYVFKSNLSPVGGTGRIKSWVDRGNIRFDSIYWHQTQIHYYV